LEDNAVWWQNEKMWGSTRRKGAADGGGGKGEKTVKLYGATKRSRQTSRLAKKKKRKLKEDQLSIKPHLGPRAELFWADRLVFRGNKMGGERVKKKKGDPKRKGGILH